MPGVRVAGDDDALQERLRSAGTVVIGFADQIDALASRIRAAGDVIDAETPQPRTGSGAATATGDWFRDYSQSMRQQIEAARGNYARQTALAEQWVAEGQALYGADLAHYREALVEKQRLTEQETRGIAREWQHANDQLSSQIVDALTRRHGGIKQALRSIFLDGERDIGKKLVSGLLDSAESALGLNKIDLSSLFSFGGGPGGGGVFGLLGSVFGGLFAEGGSPPVGQPSIIGEKGPELWVPRESGTIVPNGGWAVRSGADFGAAAASVRNGTPASAGPGHSFRQENHFHGGGGVTPDAIDQLKRAGKSQLRQIVRRLGR